MLRYFIRRNWLRVIVILFYHLYRQSDWSTYADLCVVDHLLRLLKWFRFDWCGSFRWSTVLELLQVICWMLWGVSRSIFFGMVCIVGWLWCLLKVFSAVSKVVVSFCLKYLWDIKITAVFFLKDTFCLFFFCDFVWNKERGCTVHHLYNS